MWYHRLRSLMMVALKSHTTRSIDGKPCPIELCSPDQDVAHIFFRRNNETMMGAKDENLDAIMIKYWPLRGEDYKNESVWSPEQLVELRTILECRNL